MKLFTMMSLCVALTTVAHAAPRQSACERVAVAAARRWASKQGLSGHDFQIVSQENDNDGNTLVHIQLPLYGSDGDCWTNIDVTVQEHADDSCDALKTEEDTAAESCS